MDSQVVSAESVTWEMTDLEIVAVCVDDNLWEDIRGPLKAQCEEITQFFWKSKLSAQKHLVLTSGFCGN